MAKLTKLEERLLVQVCASPTFCKKSDKTGPVLVTRNLAIWRNDDSYCGTLCITDAGRAALSEANAAPIPDECGGVS